MRHRFHRLSASVLLVACSLSAAPGYSQDAAAPALAPDVGTDVAKGNVFALDYGKLVFDDGVHVLGAPLHWSADDWRDAGLITLGIVGAGLLDHQIAHVLDGRHSGSFDRAITQVEKFGSYYSAGVVGAFYLGGLLTDNSNAKTVAQDSIAASLIATGIITPVLKVVIGRSRPEQNRGAGDFHPFNGGASFPSGHTTQAFAVASVIAAHYDEPWIKVGAYGVASLVGFARMYHGAHFLSDVLAGGVIGTVVGHSVVRFNNGKRAGRVALMPLYDGDARGIQVSYSF
jgi:membrane-associated phospholipid phosphatase